MIAAHRVVRLLIHEPGTVVATLVMNAPTAISTCIKRSIVCTSVIRLTALCTRVWSPTGLHTLVEFLLRIRTGGLQIRMEISLGVLSDRVKFWV
jgi:hypothetical protein